MTSFPLFNMSMNLLMHFPSLDSIFPTLQLCLLILLLKMFYSESIFLELQEPRLFLDTFTY